MARERILIIDDDPDLREALTLILEPAGYAITGCATGPEGLKRIRDEMPDVILLDIMLGTPSEGFHIAYELRKDEDLKKIPIIMISSIGEKYGAAIGVDYAKELGTDYMPADDFLAKPLEAAKVLETVERVLTSSSST